MKFTHRASNHAFNPFDITITIDSQEDFRIMQAIAGLDFTIPREVQTSEGIDSCHTKDIIHGLRDVLKMAHAAANQPEF